METQFGGHVINGMATELNDMGFGKVDRLTLLDPSRIMPKLIIDGKNNGDGLTRLSR